MAFSSWMLDNLALVFVADLNKAFLKMAAQAKVAAELQAQRDELSHLKGNICTSSLCCEHRAAVELIGR